MKKLYRHITLFVLPILVLLIQLPEDRHLRYAGLKNDCYNHGSWIYDRIFNNDKPADIVFLGSSHTINGIDDSLIESRLNKSGMTVVNLGYCRLGRNLHYVLLKELLEKKHPSVVVLEVRMDENRYSHPVFPFLASTRDVLFAEPFFNRDFFKDIYLHFTYKLQIAQDYLFGKSYEINDKGMDYGHSTSSGTAPPDDLNQYRETHQNDSAKTNRAWQNFYMHYPGSYLKKISRLCHQNNIRLVFLYMPGFGTRSLPIEFSTYRNFGDVLIPPQSIISNPGYYYDEDHLNEEGAKALSEWISVNLDNILFALPDTDKETAVMTENQIPGTSP